MVKTRQLRGPDKSGDPFAIDMSLEEILESYTDEEIGVCVQWLAALMPHAHKPTADAMAYTLGEIARWERPLKETS